MTASSQTLPGALPPEQPSVPRPVPLDQALAAKASEAAAAVIDATMAENDGATGEELAAAEQRAGILFDAASVEAAVSAAREQAHAEDQAELAELREELVAARRELGLMASAYRARQAVLRLCEGRRGDDLLLVSAVAVAAESGTTALDGLPMRLMWLRSADVPEVTDRVQRTVVHCESSYGGRAELVVEGDDRTALASMLDSSIIRDVHAPCPHEQTCGSDIAPPDEFGWFHLDVGGLGEGLRWYCSPGCVNAAMLRAGRELAAIDEAADDMIAVDQAEHPGEYADEPAEEAETDARCARCGCTEDAACEGGCAWVPNAQMIDLCSACATPAELQAASWKTSGGAQ
ncbi:hypothetical protein [Streptomyces sp. DH20]|uniref:hypothetical protein n=1 Tax=Streptomyces sp. DH20 TaxID=2857009 RepID=UPI001E42BCEF|nr:hypothetical protein [Streptomyces sp. DH20]